MYVDGRRGPVALRGYEDGVYVVTEHGALALRDLPSLERRVAELCHGYFAFGSYGGGQLAVEALVTECGFEVAVITCRGRERLGDHPALLAQLREVCGRAVSHTHPADAWEVD